jgi:hypothetical protein
VNISYWLLGDFMSQVHWVSLCVLLLLLFNTEKTSRIRLLERKVRALEEDVDHQQ